MDLRLSTSPEYRQLLAEAERLRPPIADLDGSLRELVRVRDLMRKGVEGVVDELRALDERRLGRRRLASEQRRWERLLRELQELERMTPVNPKRSNRS